MATPLPDDSLKVQWLMVHHPGDRAAPVVAWYERALEGPVVPCRVSWDLPSFELAEDGLSAHPCDILDWRENFDNVQVIRGSTSGLSRPAHASRHTYLMAVRTSGAQDGQPLADVARRVNLATTDLDHDGFGAGWSPDGPKEWPKSYWRCICYAVEGTSEGHYIHVDALLPNNVRQPLLLAKTFGGYRTALDIVARVNFMLGLV